VDNLSQTSRLTRVGLVALLGFCLSLIITPSLRAADVEERDIKVESQEAIRAEHPTGQAWQQETQTSQYDSAETNALGDVIASEDQSTAAQEAKGDFATGFKSVGKGFKHGAKATGRAFKTAGTTMGHGFKKTGTVMGKGFKKAGSGIKWFFTGQWLGRGDGSSDSYAEQNHVPEAQSDLENVKTDNTESKGDLELDFDKPDKSENNDWV
jgi:hypothetical protein